MYVHEDLLDEFGSISPAADKFAEEFEQGLVEKPEYAFGYAKKGVK